MTADCPDTYAYEPARKHVSEQARRHYWATAIGLQKVDGLDVSSYLRRAADAYIEGKRSLEETGELVRSYHHGHDDPEHEEADLVSQRIAELLVNSPFALTSDFLPQIHRHLFQDLDEEVYHPGEFKTERMIKQEDILNGDSVLYADPSTYAMSIRSAMEREQTRIYTTFSRDELKAFCQTIAFLWQVHPFYEGNTRTIAVFSELYLNHLGFDVENEPFERHSRYYRDALVRAMYRNASAGIMPDDAFLVAFYESVLGFEKNVLDRESLLCTPLFESPGLLRNVDPSEALHRD